MRADDLLVDLDGNRISYRGRTWKVTPQLAELLYVLRDAYPRSVAVFDIGQRLWGPQDLPDDPMVLSRRIKTLVWQARQMLRAAGIEIHFARDRGHRLSIPQVKA